jgi:monofunctional biosynthetic peptidoglycan transglycosylase
MVLLGLVAALAGWAVWDLYRLPGSAQIAQLARKRPETTALIAEREEEARAAGHEPKRVQRWIPLPEIAPELVACVVASEDARFFEHGAVDLREMQRAVEKDLAAHTYARGASTLTQQLAKNLFLSERKSLLRKGEELLLAHRMEETLTKERILELYLNEVEWGAGVYGAEAASQTWFKKSARELTLAESAELAAMLPAPRQLSPGNGAALLPRAQRVLSRVSDERLAPPNAIAQAGGELRRSLGG